jgi:lipopolysaccharide/colanic/teichoic acid biosynthesis glycosyltransferase
LFDLIASVVGLIILFPVIVLIMTLVRLNLGSPIFFRQIRPGKDGQSFEMVKVRTMRDAVDVDGNALPDSERMTPLGSFLRSSSLDELPGLWSVLKGDMSLVGPRPLLVEYLLLYSDEQARRHEVKPGITGWAQINGRNAISWEDKFKFDVWYVDNRSFWLDIKIILLTVKKVFVRDGISADGEATMSKFTGKAD